MLSDTLIKYFGRALRADGHGITQAPLPRRWVELIRHLDEEERRRSEELRQGTHQTERPVENIGHATSAPQRGATSAAKSREMRVR
jgi:hypothetical protein